MNWKSEQLWWGVWIVGAILIVLDWVNVVPNSVGLVGFFLALAGFIVPLILRNR